MALLEAPKEGYVSPKNLPAEAPKIWQLSGNEILAFFFFLRLPNICEKNDWTKSLNLQVKNMDLNVRDLILATQPEPSFFLNFHKIVRPNSKCTDEFCLKILQTNALRCWKIRGEALTRVPDDICGILFDGECYTMQWLFDLKVDNTLIEELIVYYWKGQNAPKGASPLPPEIEEHHPVERVVQWSEPPQFFQAFPRSLIVFSGKEQEFDWEAPHLLLVRGELLQEIHLYELPCEKKNLRSRASFLIIWPLRRLLVYWHGSATSPTYRENVVKRAQPHKALKRWADFSVQETQENWPLVALKGDLEDYSCVGPQSDFTPRLFYLNSITGAFQATEVDYPLRAPGLVAPFPFLQSHLYSAAQPALFLLDNHREIWLWEGLECGGTDELEMALHLLEHYVKEKEAMLGEKVASFRARATQEPVEFKNLFPFWNAS